jgi:hypothetical protein
MASAVLAELDVADEPADWTALGFAAADDGTIVVGGVRLCPLGRAAGDGIVVAAFAGANRAAGFDGLPVRAPAPGGPGVGTSHPNGALAVDHVVVTTPALERTVGALQRAGLDLRRTRDAGGDPPVRQAFLLAGPCVVEVVGPGGEDAEEPAAFWGLTIVVADLDALASRLGDAVGPPRDAVQPGRRIATLRPGRGISTRVAFMTPRPPRDGAPPAS